MASRRRPIGIALLGVTAASLVAATAWIVLGPRPTAPLSFRSDAGGFELSLPAGWVGPAPPDEDRPWVWAELHRRSRIGRTTAWLWVTRSAPAEPDPLERGRRAAMEDIRDRWGDIDVDLDDVRIGGRPAIRLRYARPLDRRLGLLPIDVHEARFVTRVGDAVFEIGIGGWRDLPAEASTIGRHVRLFEPTGHRPIDRTRDGFRLRVPAAWNERALPIPELPGAVWVATSPSGPPSEWAIVWKLDVPFADAARESVAEARELGTLRSRSSARAAGRRASRVDYELTADSGDPAYVSTWIIDRDGGSWQVLVGTLDRGSRVADRIIESLTFVR